MKPKTAVGIIAFVLLGICVFMVSSIDYQNSLESRLSHTSTTISGLSKENGISAPGVDTVEWHPPIIDAGVNTPIVMTLVLELFVALCWILLRKAEPFLNRVVASAVNTIKEDNS